MADVMLHENDPSGNVDNKDMHAKKDMCDCNLYFDFNLVARDWFALAISQYVLWSIVKKFRHNDDAISSSPTPAIVIEKYNSYN